MRYKLAILLIGMSIHTTTHSEFVSEHTQQHTAVQRALQELYSKGCVETYTRGTGKFELHTKDTSTDFEVKGSTLTVSCTKWKEPTEMVHIITWSAPITREDNSPLQDSEIKGYYLAVNGVPINVGKVTSYSFTYPYKDAVQSVKVYKVRVQDTKDQLSRWTEEVSL